jgi:hypothetical protein
VPYAPEGARGINNNNNNNITIWGVNIDGVWIGE